MNYNISTSGYIAHSMFYGAMNLPASIVSYAFNGYMSLGQFLTITIYWKTGERILQFGSSSTGISTYYFTGGTVYMYAGKYSGYVVSGNDPNFPVPYIDYYPSIGLGANFGSGRIQASWNYIIPTAGNGWISSVFLNDSPSGQADVPLQIYIACNM